MRKRNTRNLGIIIAVIVVVAVVLLIKQPSQVPPEQTGEKIVRMPVVAGQFYPSDAATLKTDIDAFLRQAPAGGNKPAALIVPHAGYVYSGAVAAEGFKLVQGRQYDSVVIIGVSHHVDWDGISVYDKGYFRTPLGDVPVDVDLAKQFENASSKISFYEPAHAQEHSVEVEIPFLQRAIPDLKIVPMVVGRPSAENIQALADALSKVLVGRDVLVVVSSDLSHYYDYDTAVRLDTNFLDSVKILDAQGLSGKIAARTAEACNYGGVLALLLAAPNLGIGTANLIDYKNSGDTAGDKNSVVGYGAVALYRPLPAYKQELLKIARQSIEGYLATGKVPTFEIRYDEMKERKGDFVTLTENGQLRGCIGYTQPVLPLWQAVSETAVKAAVEDPRFIPVQASELSSIKMEISILSPLTEADLSKLMVGTHGLMMSDGLRGGLLLPQVPLDFGWTEEQFLQQTCNKAGMSTDCWKSPSVKTYWFTADVFSEE